MKLPISDWLKEDDKLDEADIRKRVLEAVSAKYVEKTAPLDREAWHQYERGVMLQSLDTHWREHLSALDHLRQGIHLRGYAQKNPKQEYKREAFELFSLMLETVRNEVTRILMLVQIRTEEDVAEAQAITEEPVHLENVRYQHADYDEALAPDAEDDRQEPTRVGMKPGRNDPCPCGSGKKYKHCHGQLK